MYMNTCIHVYIYRPAAAGRRPRGGGDGYALDPDPQGLWGKAVSQGSERYEGRLPCSRVCCR